MVNRCRLETAHFVRCGIHDIRLFYENDVQFLKQF
jgi:phenylalanyl-tRNA synthetase alpha subunit